MDTALLLLGALLLGGLILLAIKLTSRANQKWLESAIFRLPALPPGSTAAGAFALPPGGHVDLWLDLSFLCQSAFSGSCVVSLLVSVDGQPLHQAEFSLADEGKSSPLLPPQTSVLAMNGSVSSQSDGRELVSSVHNLCPVSGRPSGQVSVQLSVRPGQPGTEIARATLLALPR